jgi:RimJ/RimL family protein N-acetyltransferase
MVSVSEADDEVVPGAGDARPAPLSTARVALRTITTRDYDYLYHLSLSEGLTHRWRYRGLTPGPDEFVRNLWLNVTAQFLVENRRTRSPIGHVIAFDASHRDHWVHAAAVGQPDVESTGLIIEALGTFVDYLFMNFDFNKIYFSSIEFSYQAFSSGRAWLFREEGRLAQHCFYGGRYWDMVLFTIFREDWATSWHETLRLRGEDTASERVSDDEVIGLDGFLEALAGELGLDAEDLKPEARLIEDLQLDSLHILVALDYLTEISGQDESHFELLETPRDLTARDIYAAYCQQRHSPLAPEPLLEG